MPEIALGKMTDRELLVVTATTVNNLNANLDSFCLRVEGLEVKLTALQTEHNVRMQGNLDCASVSGSGRSKRELAATGSIGGLIVGALILLVDYFVKAIS